MKKYFYYIWMEINTNIFKKVSYFILLPAILSLLIIEDVLHILLIKNDLSIRACIIHVSLFVILYVSSIFSIEEFIGSKEYSFFRSLKFTCSFRVFILFCKVLPYALLYTLLSIFFWNVNNGLAIYHAIYSFLGIIVISISTYDLYDIVKKRILRNKHILIYILSILLVSITTLIIYKGDNNLVISHTIFMNLYSNFFLPKWYILCLFIAWLVLYSAKDHIYEKSILNVKKRKVEKQNKRIFTNLYCNLFYKDMLSSLSNYIVILFYIIALILGCISAIYHFSIDLNITIVIIYTFITSTLSEEIMKDDMKKISFIRTLPISQHKYFKSKIFSVSTVLFIPSLIFLTVSLFGGSYTFASLILILSSALIINILLCAMQCVLIMRHVCSPEKVTIVHATLLCTTIVFPLIPVLYLLIVTNKSRKFFCGGYD